MWVHFTQAFDWKPKTTVTIAYRAGDILNVTRACADAALKRGVAEKTAKPKDAPKDTNGDDDDGLPNG